MTYPLKAINEAFTLLPPAMNTRQALVQLLAIGAQESEDFQYRRQKGNGPARGFWQFENGGGVKGVMEHKSSKALAQSICIIRGIPFTRDAVWAALETDDVLAAAFARLLLWTDPYSLPALGDSGKAWDLYVRVWRPGKPHPDTWNARYQAAMDVTA